MFAELVGIRLFDVAPARYIEFPLTPGLTALTGLNGVGKTRLLHGIFDALSGSTPRDGGWCQVLFRWHIEDGDDPEIRQLFALALGTYAEDEWPEILAERVQAMLRPLHRKRHEVIKDDAGLRCVEHRIALTESQIADALLDQHLFALVPEVGGSFRLMVAMDRRTEDPALREAIAAVDNSWDNLDALDVEDEDFWIDSDMFDAQPFPEIANPTNYGGEGPFAGDVLPVPVVDLGHLSADLWPLQPLDVDTDVDLLALTRERLAATIDSPDRVVAFMIGEEEHRHPGDQNDPGEEAPVGLLATAQHLSTTATQWYQRLLPDSPSLTCVVEPVSRWLSGTGTYWQADTAPLNSLWDDDGLSIAELGQAHQRWARFSIFSALTALDRQSRRRWLLIDEPELAVHRASERNLAQGIHDISRETGLDVIVATHSPAVVGKADRVLVVTRRQGEETRLEQLTGERIALANEVGLAPTDILGWYRQALLVEGLHDETVVTELMGDVLVRTRTLLVPLGGVRGTSATFDSRLLTDFLDVGLVLLIDGLGDRASDTWKEVQVLAAGGDTKAAISRLREAFEAKRGYEAAFLRNAGERLIQTGRADRLVIHALSVPDIVELLPVESFVNGARSWGELREAYVRETSELDFKQWVRVRCGGHISARSIKRAVERLDTIPYELSSLTEILENNGSDSH